MNRGIDSVASSVSNSGSGVFKGSLTLTVLLFVAIIIFIYNKIIHYTDIPFLEPPAFKTFEENYANFVQEIVPLENQPFF